MTEQARESVRARRAEVIDRLGPEAVLWLAAPPVCNRDAAEGAGFPATPLDDFVLAARAQGWCKVQGIMAPGTGILSSGRPARSARPAAR